MEHVNHLAVVHDVLAAAGITAGVKRPAGEPEFVRFFLLDTPAKVGRWVEAGHVELEAWAATPLAALDLLNRARTALEAAATSDARVRAVEVVSGPSELPTGEDSWERYRCSVEISTRNT